jgi:hypothetical protein
MKQDLVWSAVGRKSLGEAFHTVSILLGRDLKTESKLNWLFIYIKLSSEGLYVAS